MKTAPVEEHGRLDDRGGRLREICDARDDILSLIGLQHRAEIGKKPVRRDRFRKIQAVYDADIHKLRRVFEKVRQHGDQRETDGDDDKADDPVRPAVKRNERLGLLGVFLREGLVHCVNDRAVNAEIGKIQHLQHAREHAVDTGIFLAEKIEEHRAQRKVEHDV